MRHEIHEPHYKDKMGMTINNFVGFVGFVAIVGFEYRTPSIHDA